MLPLILATILSLPMYPLNPIEQDTLNFTNLHISAGIAGPAAMISPGPEISIKYEQLYDHPFLFRASMDYRYGRIESEQYPEGAVHRNKFILEAIYYRGTDDMTAYIGAGPVIEFNSLDEDFSINSRLQWRFRPLSDLYVVYNDNYKTTPFSPGYRALIVKFTYWINI